MALTVTAVGFVSTSPAKATPLWPGGPDVPGVGQPPHPKSNFPAPTISPGDNETVGVAEPVILNFPDPVADHDAVEKAVRITANGPVSGHFYWHGDKQLRWRPDEFWPANSDVKVTAGAASVSYHIGDEVIATADDTTHTVTVTRNGDVIKTMPTSMGKTKHETPNGTYYVGEKLRKMTMDSSTYGVPTDAPDGYRVEVEYATRLSGNGIFVHSAPWSVSQQGVTDVSHGCLNVSPADAQWFFENSQPGDPVIVTNSKGTLETSDVMGDWN